MVPSRALLPSLALAAILAAACSSDPGGGGSDGGGGGSDGGGGADTGTGPQDSGPGPQDGSPGDAGGGSCTTPVVVKPTTMTTAIPVSSTNCSGATYGTKGDLDAFTVPVCESATKVTKLTLRYDMGYYIGEPTRKAVISWEGTGAISSVQWLAEVQDMQGRQYVMGNGKRVFASYNVGSIKGPGQGFGIDSTGSPFWNETFVVYDETTGVANGVSDVDAKNIYKACFKLANVAILKLNGKPALQ